jgi:TolB-like protein
MAQIYRDFQTGHKSFLRRRILSFFALGVLSVALSSCAYRMGNAGRALPNDYKQVHVPIFKNTTQEPGIELGFTEALIQELERSKIARVTAENIAEGVLVGEIFDVTYQSGAATTRDLPTGSVLASEFRILVGVRVTLMRKSDLTPVWSQEFRSERTYVAPQVTAAGINTVNPLYNLSARRQNIQVMALELMSEAHDRLTENF